VRPSLKSLDFLLDFVDDSGVTLAGCRFIGSRERLREFPGRNDVTCFNNRKNRFLFRDTMLKLIHSDNLEYKELTKAA
jgi:hypothetical protein